MTATLTMLYVSVWELSYWLYFGSKSTYLFADELEEEELVEEELEEEPASNFNVIAVQPTFLITPKALRAGDLYPLSPL